MYNLLTDKLIGVRTHESETPENKCLPEIFSLCAEDAITSFTALRPHQWQAWHCFLAQLGAMAILRSGQPMPDSTEQWLEVISAMTVEWPDDEPWQLVVDDWQKPAFLQMPTPKGTEGDYKKTVVASDELDMLVTSKNHDLKIGAALRPSADDWVFALITLQTTDGGFGSGNYGISRMNSSYSNRCFMGLAPKGGFGTHLIRDILTLVERCKEISQAYRSVYQNPDISLLWLGQWDGVTTQEMTHLHPYFIEVCRRVRMKHERNILSANVAGSKKTRLDAGSLNGNTGDPWAPVQQGDSPKSLTLSVRGFHYEQLCRLLFDDWNLPVMCKASTKELNQDMSLICSALVRGQGITEGLHQRRIPFSQSVRKAFGSVSQRDSLGLLAKSYIDESAFVEKTLRTAVAVISAGDLDTLNDKNKKKKKDAAYEKANPAGNEFSKYVDSVFFSGLFDEWKESDVDSRERLNSIWKLKLTERAEVILRNAHKGIPSTYYRRKARVNAERYFYGAISNRYSGWLHEFRKNANT